MAVMTVLKMSIGMSARSTGVAMATGGSTDGGSESAYAAGFASNLVTQSAQQKYTVRP